LNYFKTAAASFSEEMIAAPVRDMAELETFVAEQARGSNVGLIPVPSVFMLTHRLEMATLAARHRVPVVHFNRAYPEVGGLLSYGNDIADNFRRAGTYADKVLKGEKPSDLPVQFPVKFQLVINLNTAKALGLDVPVQLQQIADEVIE
jgi:ABC-type uncharacterized transport system substrate-binding protein